MWISTRAQYGLRALIEIAKEGQPLALRMVSQRQGISQAYLDQIVAALRRSGIVRSVRGAQGGYELARPANSVSAYEVVVVLEGSIAPVECVEEHHDCDGQLCGTLELWQRVEHAVREVLEATTLADLVAEAQQLHLIQLEPLLPGDTT